MASTSTGTTSVPLADNAKNVGSNVVSIAAGVGVAQVVTPVVPQHGGTIDNLSSNWIRVVWTFAAGITAGGAAANRVTLIPPNKPFTADFGDNAGNNATGEITPITAVTVAAVLAPTATAEAGTLGLATVAFPANAGTVVINWLTT